MSNMRVFELAKEMNLPAKQLLQRIRKLGIPVSSNFNALSDAVSYTHLTLPTRS